MSDTSTTSTVSPRVDRLSLVQQLSSGSIGTVSKARSPKYEGFVALRQFQVPEWLDDVNDLIKRLLAEARAANALDHPNIARLHTGGYKGFTVFITSEYVEGPTLKQYVSGRVPTLEEVLALGKQLCAALNHAHEKGVIHHCLTPSNIKIMADGTLKVLDFGLIRDKDIYAPIPAKRLENEHYLSPEQVRGKPADRLSNLFVAATILFELLTTRHPFAGKHLGEVDKNITDVEVQPLNLVHSRVPEAVSRVIVRALSKNPRERFQSGADLATALEEAFSASPAKAATAVAGTASGQRANAVPMSASSSQKVAVAPITQKIPAVVAPSVTSATTSSRIPAVPAAAPKVSMPPAASATGARDAETASKTPTASKPASATTTKVAAASSPKPEKMPVKLLAQWKLAAAAVAVLFVVSALAISLSHRPKEKPPEPPPEAAVPVQPATNSQEVATTTASPIEVREVSSRRGSREKAAKTDPVVAAPAPVAAGELYISSVPAGATIEIAGRAGESWKTPQIMNSLTPGSYKVTVSKAGYVTETRSVEVASGNRASLEIKLVATKGYLTIAGTPTGANILIDGKDTGKLTPSDFTLDPAVHNVTIRKAGYLDTNTDIKLAAGQTVSYAPSMKMAGRTDNIKVVGGGIKKLFGGGSSQGMTVVEFKTEPKGAQIIINGKTLDKTTPVQIQVEPGNYEITLQKEGYKPVHTSLAAGANEKVKIEEKLNQ